MLTLPPLLSADSQQGKGPRKRNKPGSRPGGQQSSRPPADAPRPQQERLKFRSMGESQCPVPGCDSRGHLSGTYERHFTQLACPLYHRTSDAQTKVSRLLDECEAGKHSDCLFNAEYVRVSILRGHVVGPVELPATSSNYQFQSL